MCTNEKIVTIYKKSLHMKKYNIAFTGVYDIENYGDHLFPLVFREKMKEKKIDCKLFLFSPIGNVKQGYNQNNEVYHLCDIQKLHEQYHFDAVVIGGGGILHYASGKQLLDKNSKEFVDYKVFETWVIPSIFAYKNNVKLIWNLPGGFQEFNYFYKPLTRCLCEPVDYISVRDQYTKDILVSCDISKDKIFTCLDSAFIMRSLFNKEKLMSIKNKIIDSKKYIVYHANIHLPENEIPLLVENLYSLKCEGYDVVLLPIAYTHNDQDILNKINKYSTEKYGDDGSFILLGDKLNIMDIMAILACCKTYIGVSFHGAVTALCFSNEVIGYDYMKNGKTEDLFKTLAIPEYYITNASQLSKTISLLKENGCYVDLDDMMKKIDEHFDNICKVLNSPYQEKNKEEFYEEFSQSIFEINQFYEKCQDYDEKIKLYNNLDQLAKATHIEFEKLKYEFEMMKKEYANSILKLDKSEKELQKIKATLVYRVYRKISTIFKRR